MDVRIIIHAMRNARDDCRFYSRKLFTNAMTKMLRTLCCDAQFIAARGNKECKCASAVD